SSHGVTVSGARRSLDGRFHTAANRGAATYVTHQWLPIAWRQYGQHPWIVASVGVGSRSGRFCVLACRPGAITNPRVSHDPTHPSFRRAIAHGTAVSFPSANESQRAGLKDVIDALVADGGKLIDTASVYGNAESVIGDIVRASNARN